MFSIDLSGERSNADNVFGKSCRAGRSLGLALMSCSLSIPMRSKTQMNLPVLHGYCDYLSTLSMSNNLNINMVDGGEGNMLL